MRLEWRLRINARVRRREIFLSSVILIFLCEKEIFRWLKQAEADFEKLEVLLQSKNFDGSVFFAQQTVEKALKALCLFKLKEIPKGHSILYLAQIVKVPKEIMSGIRDLNPEYLTTQYPDIAEGIPAELYD